MLFRKFVRNSKSAPLVEPVDLITATPHFARVYHPDGRKATVSTKDLAELAGTSHFPTPDVPMESARTPSEIPTDTPCLEPSSSSHDESTRSLENTPDSPVREAVISPPILQPLRRSTSEKKPVI